MRGFAGVGAAIAFAIFCFSSPLASAQAADAALDNTTLKTMLDGLGYEAKPLTKGYLVTSKIDTWTLYVQLVLSPDSTKLGMNANLGQIPDLAAVPAKKWLDLLVANGDIDPSTFYVDRDTRKVYLHRTLDNHGITPALLRGQLENFTQNIIKTGDLWDMTK